MVRIANIELTKKRLFIAVFAIAAVTALSIYIIFYAPLLKKLGAKYLECRSCENQVINAHSIIDSSGKVYGDRILMTEKDISAAIEELTKHGKAMDINFISIKPGDVMLDAGSQYKILPVEIRIEAKDERFSNFIGLLDEMKKSLIKVKSFDVSPNQEDQSKLRATLVVNFYLSPREYE